MGRTGNAPRYLGRVHPKHKSPYLSVVTVLLVTGTMAYALAFYFEFLPWLPYQRAQMSAPVTVTPIPPVHIGSDRSRAH